MYLHVDVTMSLSVIAMYYKCCFVSYLVPLKAIVLFKCSCTQELSLSDTPVHMTLLDERPSGRLCVSYQKQTIVDAVDEIRGTIQRIPNFDIAKVCGRMCV